MWSRSGITFIMHSAVKRGLNILRTSNTFSSCSRVRSSLNFPLHSVCADASLWCWSITQCVSCFRWMCTGQLAKIEWLIGHFVTAAVLLLAPTMFPLSQSRIRLIVSFCLYDSPLSDFGFICSSFGWRHYVVRVRVSMIRDFKPCNPIGSFNHELLYQSDI